MYCNYSSTWHRCVSQCGNCHDDNAMLLLYAVLYCFPDKATFCWATSCSLFPVRRCGTRCRPRCVWYAQLAVASLGLVSPGIATDRFIPIFSWKNWQPFLSHRRLQPAKWWRWPYFSCLANLSTLLSKFSHFIRVSPSGGCHPGRSALPQWRHCPLGIMLKAHTHTYLFDWVILCFRCLLY